MFSVIINNLISNLPIILLTLMLISGIICLFDILIWSKQRSELANKEKLPLAIDYSRSFFPVFLIVFLLRGFGFQPFTVPTGSLEPTVMPGDYLFVTQYNYGLKMPIWRKIIIPTGKPQRGDIIVLHWPVNEKVLFVKRLIGLPGDDISYINKVLYINGKKVSQKFIKWSQDVEPDGNLKVKEMTENLFGVKHEIFLNPARSSNDFYHLHVPKGEYFMMGDNRDNSDDSRSWGFAPLNDLEGKAQIIFYSWSKQQHRVMWHRIGNRL